ncbi:hypothetical protein DXV75_01455 [Alteromonas aestuariivivens]|uniref:Uncharacterized protein n=1 Tax=Alteromonas aestuariivivens TaxID=1938339 RepID=A0A3D8MEA0_9ALTE|nr:hypothetical protein DXV75_01455 [Alteromonas aestuariivivens]
MRNDERVSGIEVKKRAYFTLIGLNNKPPITNQLIFIANKEMGNMQSKLLLHWSGFCSAGIFCSGCQFASLAGYPVQ